MIEHVEAHPELREKALQEVLRRLSTRWFSAQKAAVDEETKRLPLRERKKRLGHPWERWERHPILWKRSLTYLVTLCRYCRPGFDALSLEDQLDLLNQHRKRVNKFLHEQRKHVAFLEYGTIGGLPKAVESARDQVKAAVLADVEGLRQQDIATELSRDVSEERYKVDMIIPEVRDLVREGRLLLKEVLGEGGWRRKIEEMKTEANRYRSLSAEEKEVEALAESTGWTVEKARSCYQSNPEAARFMLDASVRF